MPPTIRQRNLQAKNGSKRSYGTKTSKKFSFWKSDKKSSDADILVTNAPTVLKKIYYPGTIMAFVTLLVVRLCSATWNQITDCDETYNYWEPIHYLVYGSGLQTWEYSPLYAIRSYASLWIFAGPAWYLNYLVKVSPIVLFYFLRYFLACFTAFCETVFYKAICQEFGVHVARLWLVFTLSSCGTFISSTAMLPSAWCAALSSAALGAWWFNNLGSAVFLIAVSALLGWPFAGLIGLPIALDILFRKWKIIEFATWSILSLTIVLGPVVWIDSMHYGRLVVAPFNIISYNIFTIHGPDLYGVEPWTFYFLNLFLNFNIIWVLCLLCPMLLMVCWLITQAKPRARFCQPYWLSLMPLYIWLAVFMFQPHKEERFMFPVYSMICLYGAISVDCLQKIWFSVKTYYVHVCVKFFRCKDTVNLEPSKRTHYLAQTNYVLLFILILSSLAGISRTFALYKNYHAPMEVMRALEVESVELSRVNVCFGKDWYRSPSSFFLPNENYRLRFIKSEFDGMLPAQYADGLNATQEIHNYFNAQNKEDPSTYINVTSCHYLIDSDLESPSDLQPNYAELIEDWVIVTKLPLLNAKKSHRLFRSFYIPYFNENFTLYGNIYLLRNVNMNISRILNFS